MSRPLRGLALVNGPGPETLELPPLPILWCCDSCEFFFEAPPEALPGMETALVRSVTPCPVWHRRGVRSVKHVRSVALSRHVAPDFVMLFGLELLLLRKVNDFTFRLAIELIAAADFVTGRISTSHPRLCGVLDFASL